MFVRQFAILVFCLSAAVVSAQLPVEKDLYFRAVKAHRHKVYGEFLSLMRQLDSIRPLSVKYTYDLACAYAMNDQPQRGLEELAKSVRMDVGLDTDGNPELEPLRSLPGLAEIARIKATLSAPVATSAKFLTLSEKSLHPEGLCYLKKHKMWLAAGIRDGKIVSFDKKGKCTDWLKLTYSVFAIKPDADEKFLWAATAGVPEQSGYVLSTNRHSEIVKIDIRTKAVGERIVVPGSHIFGDLAVADDGTVYATDSDSPMVLRIRGKEFSPWLYLTGRIYNLQGIALNDDQSALYVADYNGGILRVPVADPEKKEWLQMPEDMTPKGIDGLCFYRNSLIAVHNGVNPIRIVSYKLDGGGTRIVSSTVLDNNRPEFDEPTTGIVKDGDFYFFANSPWNAYDRKKQALDEAKFSAPVLMRCKLD
jgi:sugar lactone lactonase YvrE